MRREQINSPIMFRIWSVAGERCNYVDSRLFSTTTTSRSNKSANKRVWNPNYDLMRRKGTLMIERPSCLFSIIRWSWRGDENGSQFYSIVRRRPPFESGKWNCHLVVVNVSWVPGHLVHNHFIGCAFRHVLSWLGILNSIWFMSLVKSSNNYLHVGDALKS